MNNLTTRKIVLGLLMALVLVFGVQGIADAITGISTTTSETQYLIAPIEVTNGVFSIAVAVTLQASETKNSNYMMIDADHAAVSGVQGTYYYDSSKYKLTAADTVELPVLTARYRISEADAFYYNEEAITISGSSGITFYGSVQGSSVTLKETETGSKQLTASITLTGYAISAGTKTITIMDATPSTDLKSTDTKAETLTHKIYVVNVAPTIPPAISLKGITNGFKSRVYGNNDVPIHDRNSPSNYKVTYMVAKGSGTLYLQEGEIESARADRLVTSTAAKVFLDANNSGVTENYSDGVTNTVTATVDSTVSNGTNTIGVYIYGQPTVNTEVAEGTGDPVVHGAPGQEIPDAFTVTVKDGTDSEEVVVSVPVKFEVKDKTDAGGTLINDALGTIVDLNNRLKTHADGTRLTEEAGKTLYVRTGDNGVATVDFLLGDAGEQKVFVSAVGMPRKEYSLFTTSIRTGKELSNPTIQSSEGKYNLYVTVTEEDENVNDWNVEFRTSKGTLTNTPTSPDTSSTPNDNNPDNDMAATMTRVVDRTDARGIAWVIYDPKGSTGDLIVTASVTDNDTGTGDIIDDVTFNIRGGSPNQNQQQNDQQVTNTITISPSTITGAPGETVTITISNPVGVAVSLSSPNSGFPESNFSPATGSTTSFTSTVTLPSTDGTYTLFAVGTIGGTTVSDSVTVTVETTALGTLTVSKDGAQIGTQQPIVVSASPAPSSTLPFTVTSGGFRVGGGDITTAGSGRALISVPTASGSYVLTVRAAGYNPRQVTFTAGAQTTTDTTTTTTTTVTAVPSSIQISGPGTRSGTVNTQLDSPLLVRVLDAGGNGVANARVIFRVITGRGKLSERGNGRAIGVQTDARGFARANFTPTDDGPITVRASTDDISATVEFTITTGAASTTTTTTRDTGTTPGTTVSPVVHVGAASRPPMLWVDGGAIYALVGASPQRFASSVDNALNITVGGGKVYWTEKTGENSGTINSADLDGSDVTELVSVRSVPMGIAVDTAGSKLYWTASSGKIKRANLNGSGSENVMLDLPSPMDIALAGGNAYWTQGNGSVRFVNLRGQKVVRNITPIGADTPGSLVIAGGKVYWTEQTAVSAGTINSANLNGTDVRELTSVRSVPMGIAVDPARSKLYWTASSGKVKQANLNGSGATNVVSGLGSPSDMVLSNSIAAPAAATTTPTTTASNTKYDLNSDGTVDNTDAGLVADALGTSNTRYDVNGDGTVNFLDLLLVFDNRDPGAAGAPTIVGMKMSAAQIDIIEEQIDLLIATNDRSPAAMRTLIYLQQLIVTARPEKTQLLANYPNPFNPETWIPYELATDTHVRITIYNTQGVVIRSLQFGHQSAGYYTGRDRAAYWDGRNALGEQVSSGLYFYQLETDEMSSMRKMVILK